MIARLAAGRLRTAVMILAALLAGSGIGLALRAAHAQGSPAATSSLSGAQNGAAHSGHSGSTQGGSGSGSANGGAGGVQGGSGSGGAAGAGASGSGTGKAATSPYPVPTPHDGIAGHPNMAASNCYGGYEPGTTCKVIYSGVYTLVSQPAGTLIIEATIDGTVAATQTYTAPGGGHQYRAQLTFTVPQHAKKIAYTARIVDATGKVIVATPPFDTYGYG